MNALRDKRRLAVAGASAVAGLTATAAQSYAAATPALLVSLNPAGRSQNGLIRYRDVTIASHWWGYEFWFDAWATNHIVYGISGGDVIAVIFKEATGSSWIVAAVIAAAGVYANLCKHRDGTTDFVFVRWPSPFAWYCH